MEKFIDVLLMFLDLFEVLYSFFFASLNELAASISSSGSGFASLIVGLVDLISSGPLSFCADVPVVALLFGTSLLIYLLSRLVRLLIPVFN